jgi:hypothetical protein
MSHPIDCHRRVGALVASQFEGSIDKRIDIPTLHADFIGIGHGRLDPGPYAVRQIVDGVLGLGSAVRDELSNKRTDGFQRGR